MLQERFREFARDTGNIGQERVDTVNHMADELINSGHSDAATIAEWKDGLNEAWADLLELIDTRTQILAASYELHKFYHDAKEILGRIQDKHKKLPEELGRDQNTVETLQRMHTTFEHDIQALGTQVCSKWTALFVGIGTWPSESYCCYSWPLWEGRVLPGAFQVYFCGNNSTCVMFLSFCFSVIALGLLVDLKQKLVSTQISEYIGWSLTLFHFLFLIEEEIEAERFFIDLK